MYEGFAWNKEGRRIKHACGSSAHSMYAPLYGAIGQPDSGVALPAFIADVFGHFQPSRGKINDTSGEFSPDFS